jgi:hypothetical protein
MTNNLNTNSGSFVYPFVLPPRPTNVVHIRQKNAYPELARFRQRLLSHQTAHLARPHCYYRRKTNIYRAIFISLAFVFLGLFTFLLFHKATLFGGLTLGIGIAMKAAGCTISCLLFIASLIMSFSVNADHEAIVFLWRQEKVRLKRAYRKKKLRYGWQSFIPHFA